MLTDVLKDQIRDRLKKVADSMPGFRSRGAQRVMIAEVAKTLARCPDQGTPTPGSTILCAQGGTGIGKSLAYFLPAVIMAIAKKKKLVLSSSTVALQEQLTKRDIPFFLKSMGIDARVEIAKGRSRYVCIHRLGVAIGDMNQAALFGRESRDRDGRPSDTQIVESLQRMATDYRSGKWNGDRDAWTPAVDDVAWQSVTTDRHGCLGRNCPQYRGCAQMAARQRLKEASVIVANHDLVLADLANGESNILPAPGDALWVFDEVHSLPGKAISSFASSHQLQVGRRSMERLAQLEGPLVRLLGPGHATLAREMASSAESLSDALRDAIAFFGSVHSLRPTERIARPKLEFKDSCIPDEFFAIGDQVRAHSDRLALQSAELIEALGARTGTDASLQAEADKITGEMGSYAVRNEDIGKTWKLFLSTPEADGAAPIAKWVEFMPAKGSAGPDFMVCASPVTADAHLRRTLWEKVAGAICCSATLTTLGSFDNFLSRSGLSGFPDVACIDLPSPFNYPEQASLTIPKMRSSAKDYEAHTTEVTAILSSELAGDVAEGTLVIFSSRRQMEDVASRLPTALRSRILCQGSLGKAALLDAHRARIDSGRPSVLFGLDGLSEGIDLQGKYCTHVIIAKLPFQAPDDPVTRALCEWIDERGGNAFLEVSVPDAARKLEQSVGRLIRTETDRGRVTVLDMRLWTTSYGRSILRGLPPFRLVALGKNVRADQTA
jgi:ATP-dependent DNA helicase DinG